MNSPGTGSDSSRPHRDRDQVQAVVDVCVVGRVDEVEVVGGHRGDIGEQVVGPRRIGQRAGDLGVDDRAAVPGVQLDQPAAMENPVARIRS